MASSRTIKAAYWPSWSPETFPPSATDTTLFTHVYYAFLVPNNDTFKLEVPNGTAALLRNFTSALHQKNPPVKTLLSIGGYSCGSRVFGRMASQKQSRKIFINSAIEVARKFRFDGLDLDWEFPENQNEMRDLGKLLEEWRAAIKKEAQSTNHSPLLLTAAVYFAAQFRYGNEQKYPVESIKQSLDWVGAMCYDYYGNWTPSATGAHAALRDPNSSTNTISGITSWIEAGVLPHMVVMGLPLYGRTWELKDPNRNGIGAPAVGVGPGDQGILHFHQVEEFNRENGASVVYDENTVSTYSYAGKSWIGYDDVKSTTKKIEFAKGKGLRGYFFWALSYESESKISKQASKAWDSQ